MAEHFYSLHQEDSAFMMNYGIPQQQQQQQQQQQSFQYSQHNNNQSVIGVTQQSLAVTLPNDTYDYISAGNNSSNNSNSSSSNSSVTYFTGGMMPTKSIDLNNNNNNNINNNGHALQYFGGSQMFQKLMPSSTNSLSSLQQVSSNNLKGGSFMHANGNSSMPSHNMMGLGIGLGQSNYANMTSSHNGVCQFSNTNANQLTAQNRNRYMPYNFNRGSTAALNNTSMQSFGSLAYNTTPITSNAVQAPISLNSVPATANSAVTELPYARGTTPNSVQALNRNKSGSTGLINAIADISNTNKTVQAGGLASSTSSLNTVQAYATVSDPSQTVTLQITNLDYSLDEANLRYFLMNQLKPFTPVVSLIFEGNSYAKVTVPDLYFAKQVVSNLHRKKIGHKRMLVSYTRDSSLTEINTLRCQVAGLLRDVPYNTLPMYKFRELFQSRFKTSISVLDLYKMPDICNINTDNNEEKFISLQSELINSLETSPLMEGLQHSVPYCTIHFKREQHKGWAEQEIEPLPNVSMTIVELESIIYPLLKNHPGDIPVASLVHCIESEMSYTIVSNDNGVNLEHLICCVQGIQIQMNNFGIKILGIIENEKDNNYINHAGSLSDRGAGILSKNSISDSLYQISREVMELVKMSPKATMKFSRFIPAYHNHFGKQCRVADYGYTKLIELFEALSSVIQIMGDGENRQITLTHRTQVRRFTSDLLRVLRTHGNKSVLLSQLPSIFSQAQNRNFDITDYGVCDIVDILDGLVNSNIVVLSTVQNGKDILISMPKRKPTTTELEKTTIFAAEMVELFRSAPQYTILFQKLVRSYHYHFAYQCRLSDYGFLKLADLMEAIHGIVEMEQSNDEDKKIYLTPKVAQRVFAEQFEELIRSATGTSKTPMKLNEILTMHKKKFGYQMQLQSLGTKTILEAIELMPYIEVFEREEETWIICHSEDVLFRSQCYRACKFLITLKYTYTNSNNNEYSINPLKETTKTILMDDFLTELEAKHKISLSESTLTAMKHAIEIYTDESNKCLRLTNFMQFLISIIQILEKRPTMILLDIKKMLDLTLSTTFEFGYPNLYTVLTAYPDIFSVNMGLTHERSEVSLLPNCELRSSTSPSHHLFGSLKLPLSKQTKPARLTRTPLGENNTRNCQGPPSKTRALSVENIPHPMALASAYGNSSNYRPHKLQEISSKANQASENLKAKYGMLDHGDTSGVSDTSTGILNASSSSTISNKENSLNNSLNMYNLNSSFNLSNLSVSDLNNSLSGNAGFNFCLPSKQMPTNCQVANKIDNNNLWDRRFQKPLQSQNSEDAGLSFASGLSRLVIPGQTFNEPLPYLHPNGVTTPLSTGLYELVNNMNMCPIYEPPKPDTPPSKEMPFWIDPIWTHMSMSQAPQNNLLNIKLPELKSFNVLPMVLSPYTISKNENMRQQTFNFDNHDRKIA